ncbi:MAG: DUF885 domain-containing protein, partial [Clostridiales bacterium]|nr:DUF885 domain-containing protein [Clostridiales bacterium]
MKKQFRALTLLLVLLLALSSFFGCVQQQRLSEADLAFLALDREYGIYMLMDDPSSIVQFMTKPEDYGIDLSEVEMHLGRFSLDNQAQWYADMRDFSVRLQEIDASKLSAQNKIAYATMEQELADELIAAEKDYDIYYEPLVPYVGMQSNLPLTFAIWELDDVDDIEIYMVLLRDVPAFLENILEWEQLRADAGIFMTEHALDGILDDLGETIKAKDANALLSHFDDCVNAMADLSDEQKAEYIAVHRKVVVNDYNAAFIALRDGLETLRPKCREPLGALASGDEKYMAYFMDRTRITTGYNFDLDEAYAQLEDGMTRWISLYRGAIDQSDDLFEFRMDGVSEAADELRELTYTFLPALQAHSVNYVNVPKELEEQFSPAAYLIPPIDDWFRNTVLVNKPDEDETLFFTMAHEAYPGHLYQYNYQRALDLPL